MKTIVTVESFDEMAARKLERARKFDRGEAIVPERRISFERAEDMFAFLTGPRADVLRATIAKPRSITELASALNRNRSAVSRDVRALREHGMVTVKRQVNPGHGQVAVVKAAAKRFELRAQIIAA
ncbi:helix-turn-helix domain-containing protein [Terriglobus sp.]|uniref:HVO_A0114 family putative DNA-binding protein n=1 Tax=Terriglobus sp. TaxID=1889013 RepID=UPI003B000552